MNKKSDFFERGQDLIEYAIIFPILFMVLVGIFDLGRVVYYYSALTNVAREGARWAVINPTDTANIKGIVCYYAVGLDLGCPNPPVTVTPLDQDSNGRDDHIRVNVSYDFKPVTPLMGSFLGLGSSDTLSLHGPAIMRLEQ